MDQVERGVIFDRTFIRYTMDSVPLLAEAEDPKI